MRKSNLRRNMPKRNARKAEIARGFVDYLQSLDDDDHCDFILKLAAECGVTREVVYSWKYLSVRIPEEYFDIIDNCIGYPVLAPFKSEHNGKS